MKMSLQWICALLFCYSAMTFAIETVYSEDLGEFSNAYQRFGTPLTPVERDKQNRILYDEAVNENSSILKRYTNILLLGLNEANPSTRPLAIRAIDKLIDDAQISDDEKDLLEKIKNLIAFNQQNDPRNKPSPLVSLFKNTKWTNEFGVTLLIDNINPTTQQINGRIFKKDKKAIFPLTGYIQNNIFSFSTPTASCLGNLKDNELHAFLFSTKESDYKQSNQIKLGQSTFLKEL